MRKIQESLGYRKQLVAILFVPTVGRLHPQAAIPRIFPLYRSYPLELEKFLQACGAAFVEAEARYIGFARTPSITGIVKKCRNFGKAKPCLFHVVGTW